MIPKKSIWLEPEPLEIPAELLEFTGNNPFLAGELILRGMHSVQAARAFVDPASYTPSSPFELQDMEIAADILLNAIKNGELVGIWGDFDVDGQTSTTILVEGLRKLGARVKYHIPVRGKESHGISIDYLSVFLGDDVDVMLTCDTGITSHQAIEYAKAKGKKVVVTDHHSLPDSLPSSDANINPRRLPHDHPLSYLCGAGTAYKLIEALYSYFNRAAETSHLLDLVALGTIADVAELRGDNRYLVKMGLNQMKLGSRLAIKAMADAAGITLESINEEHVSYAFAPRLNSIGRLGDANPTVSFFSTSDAQEINVFASHLEGLNIHRKLIVDQVIKSALDQIKQNPELLHGPALILENENWPGGVIGIAASRLVELYQMPTILFTTSGGEIARGSARSIEGIDISRALAEQAEILISFGGHPMAAGLSLPVENLPNFRKSLSSILEKMTAGLDLAPRLNIHAYLNLSEIDSGITESLELLAPYGQGNPLPILVARDMTIASINPLGRNEDHSQLILQNQNGNQYKAIWWQSSALPVPQGVFDLAYSIRKTTFRGQDETQIQWVDYRQKDFSQDIFTRRDSPLNIVDMRDSTDQFAGIQKLVIESNAQIWAEGIHDLPFPCANRMNLVRSEDLVIAAAPPSPQVLREILSISKPTNVYLFNLIEQNDHLQAFLQRLAGLVLFNINKRAGRLDIREVASVLGSSSETIKAGVNWLVANGTISADFENEAAIQIRKGGSKNADTLARATKKLNILLEETRAYRNYYREADCSLLLNVPNEKGENLFRVKKD